VHISITATLMYE